MIITFRILFVIIFIFCRTAAALRKDLEGDLSLFKWFKLKKNCQLTEHLGSVLGIR